MESDNFYIIGGDNEKVSNEINENSKVVFIDKEQEKFRNKYSLIKDFQDKQSALREKWLSFQEEVFKKIQTFLNKDDDFSYLLSSIFFEASPNKTNSIYKFFKLKLIIDYIESPNTVSLEGEKYALLKIPICKNLKANDTNIQDTFAKIPLINSYWLGFNSDALSVSAKYYNPPLATLNRFDISFHTFDKKLSRNQNTQYDFNGRDHVLVFAITTLFQQARYLEFNEE